MAEAYAEGGRADVLCVQKYYFYFFPNNFLTIFSLRHGKYPRAVFQLVLHVHLFVVGLVCLQHLPQYFQPALAQAAQGAGMAFALKPFLLIVDRRNLTFFLWPDS